MSTAKPRITVTLESHPYEVLSRLSAAGGESMSAILSQLLDAALPSMERLVVVLERARDAPAEVLAGLSAAVERAERDLMPALVDAQKQGDMFLAQLAAGAPAPAAAAGAQRTRPRAAPVRVLPDPSPSNTGVRSPGAKRNDGKRGKRG